MRCCSSAWCSPQAPVISFRSPEVPRLNLSQDASEAAMAGRGVDILGMARRGAVAPAVVRRTKVRAALEHLARDAGARLARIVAAFGPGAARVRGDTTGLGRVGLVPGWGPSGRPFPSLSGH